MSKKTNAEGVPLENRSQTSENTADTTSPTVTSAPFSSVSIPAGETADPLTKGVMQEDTTPKGSAVDTALQRCKHTVIKHVDNTAQQAAKEYQTGYQKSGNVFQSFHYASQGLVRALKNERNLRIHAFAAGYVLFFTRYYDFSKGEIGVLLLAIGLVIVSELLNTALEKAVDVASPGFHSVAKQAKDVAAGAVLVSGLTSAVVGVYFFWDLPVLQVILADITQHWYVFVVVVVLTVLLIFLPELLQQRGLRQREKENQSLQEKPVNSDTHKE